MPVRRAADNPGQFWKMAPGISGADPAAARS
jgi:hypothetical protein